mmetsp:Transcript_17517/g.32959  ORF Transcript_17517/g.32959 Transcript_17517/m.32959 type:complete len:456 (+) Transcript_17517:32-1399(+)
MAMDHRLASLEAEPHALATLPVNKGPTSAAQSFGLLVGQAFGFALLLPPFMCMMPWSVLGRCFFGPDPTSPRISTTCSLMRKALFDRATCKEMGPLTRLRVALSLLMISMRSHSLWSCCWYIDELYGCFGGWKSAQIISPIFLISNARTGSSEFGARLYSEGKRLLGPNVLQCLLPYCWVWGITRFFFRDVQQEEVTMKMQEGYRKKFPEMFKRHPFQPFSLDTFEVAQNMTSFTFGYLNLLAGPNVPPYGADPDPAKLHGDVRQFCRYTDAMLKKTLHFSGRPDRRPFLKGHFIHAADELAARYPNALFVDLVREVGPMLRSQMNFVHLLPCWQELGVASAPWAWLRLNLLRANLDYCDRELLFFHTEKATKNTLVLKFQDCIQDLPRSLRQVFDAAGIEVTEEEIARAAQREAGAKSERGKYEIDVPLDQLQIPEAWLTSAFRNWSQKMCKSS